MQTPTTTPTPAPGQQRSVAIDPRLQARRRDIRRRQGRQRRRRLTAAVGALAVASTGWALALSPVLDVDRVVVKGAAMSGDAILADVAGIDPGQAMATLDLRAARLALEAAPWVAVATVRRSWPGTVVISVSERQPVAAVRLAGDTPSQWALVDADGRQLRIVADGELPPLVRVEGFPIEGRPGARLGPELAGALELAGRLSSALPLRPSRVTLVAGAELEAVVSASSGSPEVRALLGNGDHLDDKVVALVTVLEQAELKPGPELSVIDVRVPDAPVLT
ncbi:MAG: cell division protein FtsQ/DivIB [Acidimicrobiales bacterium]